MIQIEAIHIEEFRGVRVLDLTLGCRSFAIYGPNGSGKSGVVDAIDFALSGSVARLTGAGTAGLSVLRHAPHVHRRDDPASAVVSLTLRDPSTSQVAVLTRCVKNAALFTLSPDTPEMREAIKQAQAHPELTLSRREIIKYIVAEAGKRAQEVQALLKLDRLDETRRLLKSVQTKTASEDKRAQADLRDAETTFLRHLDLPALLAAAVVAQLNKHRLALGLEALQTIDGDTDLDAGVEAGTGATAWNKQAAVRDVRALVDWLADRTGLQISVHALTVELGELAKDPTILASLQHQSFMASGLELTVDLVCPLCDTEWDDLESLRAHIVAKLDRAKAAVELQERISASALDVVGELRRLRALIRTARPHADGSAELQEQLDGWAEDLLLFEGRLSTAEGVIAEADRLGSNPMALAPTLPSQLAGLSTELEARPDDTAARAASKFLTVAQERWNRISHSRAVGAKAAAAYSTANAVYDAYSKAADHSLVTLYETVQGEFADYYRAINSDDEGQFKAQLDPSGGKLDLEVDFHGLGMYPPAAYHSEGHQDGMGVCLYLALVKQMLGTDFRFAVLDDVVMSVDSNHRRQFCELLIDRFPDVQFIITTHDEIWANQMETSGLVRKSNKGRFQGWTVDDGPFVDLGDELWLRITSDLARDDVPGAAHKLRRGLEAAMKELAGSLRAPVPFKADNRYELGELLDSVKGHHAKLLGKAAASANSWNKEPVKQLVESLKKARVEAVLAQAVENWAINAVVHHNALETFSKADFVPVVQACRQFLDLFRCTNPECGTWIYLVGQNGREEELKCRCGEYWLNLQLKAK